MENWVEKRMFDFYENKNKHKMHSYRHIKTDFEIDVFSIEGEKQTYIITVFNPKNKSIKNYKKSNEVIFIQYNKARKNELLNNLKNDIERLNPKDLSFIEKYKTKYSNQIVKPEELKKYYYNIL